MPSRRAWRAPCGARGSRGRPPLNPARDAAHQTARATRPRSPPAGARRGTSARPRPLTTRAPTAWPSQVPLRLWVEATLRAGWRAAPPHMAVEGTARAAEGDSTRPRDNSGSSGGSSDNHRRRLATLTVAVVCVLARIVAAAAPAASAGAAAAAPLRAGLCGGAFEALAARPELASPLTSALRIAEGAELARLGSNPYAGGACRAHPIVLQALTPLVLPPPGAAPSAARRLRTAAPFVIADVLAAAALAYAAGAVRAAYRCAEATARARGGEVERRRQPRHRKGSASSSSSGTISSSNASPSAKVPVPTRAPEAAEERDGQREERGDPRQQRHREEPHAVSRAAQQLDMAAVRERASLVARLPGAPPPDVVALLYLANPLTFAACVGLSAGAFENAALLGALGAACALRTSVAGALAALAAAVGVQPVLAAPALALLAAVGPWAHGEDERVAESGAAARASGSAPPATAATLRRGLLSFVLWFALASAALAGAARALMADAPGGALPAARAIAGHALLGEELEPNLGMCVGVSA